MKSPRYAVAGLAILGVAAIVPATIPAQAAPTFEVSGEILDGIDGVVVDGSTYNVTFVPGSCNSVFNGCDFNDFTFQNSGSDGDAATALSSILSGGIFNPAFPNGIVDENQVGTPFANDTFFTPDIADYMGLGIVGGFSSGVGVGGSGTPIFLIYLSSDSSSFTTDSGNAYAVWTPASPTSVPEPGTVFLFGAGLLGLGALRRRRKVKIAVKGLRLLA
jgi:hypothetical protein